MSHRYYACVYGGANDRIAEKHKTEIERMGKLLAEMGYSLVYGAGATGCMGAVARGFAQNSGFVMGVTPTFMGTFEEIFDCDNTVMVETMGERKTIMEKTADIFLIAPGGIGTMDEFFQVLTLKYLKRLSTPIVVLNLDGFYDALLLLIDSLIKQGALTESVYDLFDVTDAVDSQLLLNRLKEIKNN